MGDGLELRLPSGSKFFEVVEKAVFKPVFHASAWDSRNTVFRSEDFGPLTIASLRELLAQAGVSEEELDLLDRELAEEDEANNIVEGLRRSVITAMQLRDLPILDKFQDDIFRLPLDSRLVILGPPARERPRPSCGACDKRSTSSSSRTRSRRWSATRRKACQRTRLRG